MGRTHIEIAIAFVLVLLAGCTYQFEAIENLKARSEAGQRQGTWMVVEKHIYQAYPGGATELFLIFEKDAERFVFKNGADSDYRHAQFDLLLSLIVGDFVEFTPQTTPLIPAIRLENPRRFSEVMIVSDPGLYIKFKRLKKRLS